MAHELSIEFTRLLDEYDEKRRVVDDRKRQVKLDEAAFFDGFSDVRARVIRPLFEAVAAALKARGHDSRILEEETSAGPDGKTAEAAISIRVVAAGLKGLPPRDALPTLTFSTRHYNKTVCIHGSSTLPHPAGASPKRDYRLPEIDRDLVQAALLRLVAGMVNDP